MRARENRKDKVLPNGEILKAIRKKQVTYKCKPNRIVAGFFHRNFKQ
jgi:hypothetical protein